MSKTSITNWFWIFTLATILTTHYADNPSYIARYLTKQQQPC